MNRTKSFVLASLTFALAAAAGPAEGPATEAKTLTIEGARNVIAAAVAEASRRQTTGAFAVVDCGGNLIAVERLDGTFAAAANIAIGKARTAALFRKPTRVFEDIITKGRTPMIALDDFTPLQGGVPVMVDGAVVGAIGVSGAASAKEDDELADIGAAAVLGATATARSAAASEVLYVPAAEVKSAFARGAPVTENDAFKVHASRRDRPGQAEVHRGETDIVYVLEGTASFVTGGTVVNGVASGPGEIRGDAIKGGLTHTLVPGDVIVVPAGVPHWFRDVDGPFLYYVVKVL